MAKVTGEAPVEGGGELPDESGRERPSPIRPFLLTAGRVAGTAAPGSGPPIPIETQVVATSGGLAVLDSFASEHRDIIAACRRPQSLAELAAKLRLHLNVVRVIADDLRAQGRLRVYVPRANAAQDASVLRRVIDGLRTVPDSRGFLREG
ncbi:DUF742 domain-containing protein [Streptomyces fuscigenes]|uniref:DUF742 domain-containing protein n=1 Tax=Streptomyces fuscigenes TaxID=1528880 RepID=UPI003559058C